MDILLQTLPQASSVSVTLDLWLKVIATASTLAIGVAAWLIAYQQYKISKSKLKFDLYDRRFALFMIAREFASQIAITNDPIDAGKFYRSTIERYFLFDKEVYSYFDEVYNKANELKRAEMLFSRPNITETEAEALRNQISVLKVWFFDQSNEMINVFSKDLSIKTLK